MIVGFADVKDIYLGKVKYIGIEKKKDNYCNGSCAGIQYFECAPGYGCLHNIERIIPQSYANGPPSPL
ncbi:unnamed protein product [Acanthoscelides obtectus]|uniref:CAP-Gly domain-containing protein n=1 Tax=Acanthoscelides obtectus TaxID=200917 RepID=A0A9P0PRZ9_ACAOB|nr:unnamed protein product [Acanthoscelides obtectus]CAK1643075.1 hypothetical protein AOBTE_LOCUS13408 [Acanthoscelides obtectus]